MPSRRTGLLLTALGLLGLLAVLAGLAVYWSQCGPGVTREVERLASLVELRPGMTVAEIGAGTGRMTVRMARRLGPSGQLYATELDPGKLEAIRSAASAAGLGNLAVIQAGESSTGLPDTCCDLIYMRRVFHHFTEPASMSQSLYRALRPGGRLAVIDFLSPGWMFFLRHGIPREVVAAQLTSAGFRPERRVDGWSPIDYCLVYRKPPGP
jgi:ubiquinone/menaquinone biosynthesis C-methylase UbiE